MSKTKEEMEKALKSAKTKLTRSRNKYMDLRQEYEIRYGDRELGKKLEVKSAKRKEATKKAKDARDKVKPSPASKKEKKKNSAPAPVKAKKLQIVQRARAKAPEPVSSWN